MNSYFWYNYISGIYDYFTILPYRRLRLEAITKLNITLNDTVIDLGCGTGLNLEKLSQAVGSNGMVIAVEPSNGMIKQARKKYESFALKNVVFIEKSFSEYLCSAEFREHSKSKLKVISTLVISVIPDWEQNIRALIRALPNGSHFLIMDLFSEKRSLTAICIDKLAQSNTDRKSWIILEETLSGFMMWWYKIPFYFGVRAFIAKGIKES